MMAKANMADAADTTDTGDAPLIDLNDAEIKKLIAGEGIDRENQGPKVSIPKAGTSVPKTRRPGPFGNPAPAGAGTEGATARIAPPSTSCMSMVAKATLLPVGSRPRNGPRWVPCSMVRTVCFGWAGMISRISNRASGNAATKLRTTGM